MIFLQYFSWKISVHLNKNFHLDNEYFLATYHSCHSKTNHKQIEVLCHLKTELKSSLEDKCFLKNIYFLNRKKATSKKG